MIRAYLEEDGQGGNPPPLPHCVVQTLVLLRVVAVDLHLDSQDTHTHTEADCVCSHKDHKVGSLTPFSTFILTQ